MNSCEYENKKNQQVREGTPLDKLKGKKADELIKRYELDQTVPINLDNLCKSCNIQLYATDFSTLENNPKISAQIDQKGAILGAVIANDTNIKILYRKTDSVHRQRFTIAHELAHCCQNAEALANRARIDFRTDIEITDPSHPEYMANVFAGELLIPESILKSIYQLTPEPDVTILASMFDVSKNVMRERLKHLGYTYKDNLI